jgi:hypothetical protein
VTGKVVTYSMPGETAHGPGLALDAPLLYDDGNGWAHNDDPRWHTINGRIAQALGLEWGGLFVVAGRPFFDAAHVQQPGWAVLAKGG